MTIFIFTLYGAGVGALAGGLAGAIANLGAKAAPRESVRLEGGGEARQSAGMEKDQDSEPLALPESARPMAPNPKATPNAPVQTAAARHHPIIVVTGTQVTNNTATRHIEISITLANQTSEEVNTHITFTKFVVTPTGERRQTGPPDERNIGFPALPFTYQLTYSFDTSAEGEENYAGGSFVECVVDVTYPDLGGRTIYHFRGKTNPTINHLDYVLSEWEHLPR